jgi:hypothetical protein
MPRGASGVVRYFAIRAAVKGTRQMPSSRIRLSTVRVVSTLRISVNMRWWLSHLMPTMAKVTINIR